jgi:hypothetical protein
MGKKSRFGSRINIPEHISEKQFFGIKILVYFDADPDPGSEIFLPLDPGWKKFGFGNNIPDP